MCKIARLTKKFISVMPGAILLGSMFAGTVFAAAPDLPNLTIPSISVDASGRLYVIQKNTSNVNVAPSILGHTYIWIDDMTTPVWTYRWDTLDAGARGFLNFNNASSLQPQLLSGTHTVKACIDANNIVAESDESDNCLTTTNTTNTYVQPPDFTVDTIYLEFDTLTVEVRGGSPTPVPYDSDGTIYIWIDDMVNPVWIYSWKKLTDNQFLQGGGKHSIITPQALYGSHRVKACVDAENDVEESHEENNCLTVNLRGNPVPVTNTNSSNACSAPYVLYQGRCTDPIPACQNPPAHFLPSSCIDKIEGGRYIERYNFQCESGYIRSGSECVRVVSRAETNGPDLKIISAEVLPYNANYGDEFGFDFSNVPDRSSLGIDNMALRVTVKNVGDEDAFSPYDVVGLWVKFLRADEDWGWKELSTKLVNGQNLFIEKGTTRTFTFNIPSQVNNGSKEVYYIFPGNNSIELTVDRAFNDTLLSSYSTGYIAESNENNNTYTVKFEADAAKTAPKNSGLKYSVDLTSNPESYPIDEDGNRVFDSIWSEVKAEKGDKIIFTRHVNNQNAVNDAWNWNVESMLDCAPYPDFDSSDLRCTVVKEGLSKVSITMFPVTADGTRYTVNSNTIYVNTGAKNSSVQYTGSLSARTDGTVSVPPAGFEKDVQVGTQMQNNPFSDTNMATVAGKAAAALYNYGIIGGFPDGEFKGSRSVNRAEAAKFLLLSRYESVPDNQNNGYFYDVLNGEWYTKYVITAAGLGIIGGYGDGTFRPADTVNTAEFLKMLTLTFELETGLPYSFTDVDGSAWYAGYVGVATKYKLFPDRGNKLQPARLLTRNEVAVAIYQYLSNRD